MKLKLTAITDRGVEFTQGESKGIIFFNAIEDYLSGFNYIDREEIENALQIIAGIKEDNPEYFEEPTPMPFFKENPGTIFNTFIIEDRK